MEQELTADEQRQAHADLNLGMQLAIDERDLDARAKLQARAAEIAQNIADERAARQVDAISAKAASSEAAQEARAEEAHAEAEGAPLTPGDDVAKAVAAGQAAEADVEAKQAEAPADKPEQPSKAEGEAEHTKAVEGPNQGPRGTRADKAKAPDSKAKEA